MFLSAQPYTYISLSLIILIGVNIITSSACIHLCMYVYTCTIQYMYTHVYTCVYIILT